MSEKPSTFRSKNNLISRELPTVKIKTDEIVNGSTYTKSKNGYEFREVGTPISANIHILESQASLNNQTETNTFDVTDVAKEGGYNNSKFELNLDYSKNEPSPSIISTNYYETNFKNKAARMVKKIVNASKKQVDFLKKEISEHSEDLIPKNIIRDKIVDIGMMAEKFVSSMKLTDSYLRNPKPYVTKKKDTVKIDDLLNSMENEDPNLFSEEDLGSINEFSSKKISGSSFPFPITTQPSENYNNQFNLSNKNSSIFAYSSTADLYENALPKKYLEKSSGDQGDLNKTIESKIRNFSKKDPENLDRNTCHPEKIQTPPKKPQDKEIMNRGMNYHLYSHKKFPSRISMINIKPRSLKDEIYARSLSHNLEDSKFRLKRVFYKELEDKSGSYGDYSDFGLNKGTQQHFSKNYPANSYKGYNYRLFEKPSLVEGEAKTKNYYSKKFKKANTSKKKRPTSISEILNSPFSKLVKSKGLPFRESLSFIPSIPIEQRELFYEVIEQYAILSIAMLNLEMQIYSKDYVQNGDSLIDLSTISCSEILGVLKINSKSSHQLHTLYNEVEALFQKYNSLQFSLGINDGRFGIIYIKSLLTRSKEDINDLGIYNYRSLEAMVRNIHLSSVAKYNKKKLDIFLSVPLEQNSKISLLEIVSELKRLENYQKIPYFKEKEIEDMRYLNIIKYEQKRIDELMLFESENFFFYENLWNQSDILKLSDMNLRNGIYPKSMLGDMIHIAVSKLNNTKPQKIAFIIMEKDRTIENVENFVGNDIQIGLEDIENNTYFYKYFKKFTMIYCTMPKPFKDGCLDYYLTGLNQYLNHVGKDDPFYSQRLRENIRLNIIFNTENLKSLSDTVKNKSIYEIICRLSIIYGKIPHSVYPSSKNGTIGVSALTVVSEHMLKRKVDGNAQLSFLTPDCEKDCSLQLILKTPEETDLKISFIKWMIFNSNPQYKNTFHCSKFFVFISLNIISKDHLDKYQDMSILEYDKLVRSCLENEEIAKKFYPLPNILIELNSDNYFKEICVFSNVIPARYVYIKVLKNSLVDPSGMYPGSTSNLLVFRSPQNISRLPEINIGGDVFCSKTQ
ncbi:hypothetical protein AYI68_g5695 [Smittium mucronatum]|uniref:Uncharacterized protein n=1 Tax=Smittium mucronatum TaxID=133383 RepID=A0A1R0GTK9_9FUNG|nr:hypothetical protein AYI68_g5695 [Smittium mucronatum]